MQEKKDAAEVFKFNLKSIFAVKYAVMTNYHEAEDDSLKKLHQKQRQCKKLT